MDKFNGFSQDEIKNVEKKINTYNNKPTKPEATQDLKRITGVSEPKRTGIGIRRVLDKQNNNNNNNNHNNNNNEAVRKVRKITGTASTASVNSAPTTKTMKSSLATTTDAGVESSDGSTMENKSIEVSVDRSMSKSIEEALFFQPLKEAANEDTLRSVSTIANTQTSETEDTQNTTSQESLETPFKGVSLKEFEVHRKLIEEQNNQKKRLLCKAIELHSEKTAAEARKIQEIKSELAELDNQLSVDVGILRKQIEAASLHFANVEKQYIKIEAQFLKSKMELHQAAEKKELLTEHLCTVIAHNEDRKAEKLSELMLKVGLTPSGDFQTQTTNATPTTMQL